MCSSVENPVCVRNFWSPSKTAWYSPPPKPAFLRVFGSPHLVLDCAGSFAYNNQQDFVMKMSCLGTIPVHENVSCRLRRRLSIHELSGARCQSFWQCVSMRFLSASNRPSRKNHGPILGYGWQWKFLRFEVCLEKLVANDWNLQLAMSNVCMAMPG